jgi:hypothetical protein
MTDRLHSSLAGVCQKSDLEPGVVSRRKRRADAAAALAEAYADVDRRENNVCQASGVPLNPRAIDPKYRREHHHIRGRRVKPEWRADPDRICLVSALAHQLITVGFLLVEGDYAPKARFHWADHVKPEQRIFRIKSRRRSQQRCS